MVPAQQRWVALRCVLPRDPCELVAARCREEEVALCQTCWRRCVPLRAYPHGRFCSRACYEHV